MAEKQSRLDKEGILYRDERVDSNKENRYNRLTNAYDGDNPDALAKNSDEEHPQGKGTGVEMGYVVRNVNADKHDYPYNNLVTTEEAGGYYDKNGTKGVEKAFQGDSGREWAKQINIYSRDNSYGKDSVDIDASVKGQFLTK